VVTEWLCLHEVVSVLSVQCTYARNLARHSAFLLLLLLCLLIRWMRQGRLGARL
jgi:hypothetical protein